MNRTLLYVLHSKDMPCGKPLRRVVKSGGFDIVIGNPPYVQIQGMEKELKEGYKEANYKNYISTGDIY